MSQNFITGRGEYLVIGVMATQLEGHPNDPVLYSYVVEWYGEDGFRSIPERLADHRDEKVSLVACQLLFLEEIRVVGSWISQEHNHIAHNIISEAVKGASVAMQYASYKALKANPIDSIYKPSES